MMKKSVMSLALVMGFGFWSSYGGAGYMDDQVFKYCKAFMPMYLNVDSKNLRYEKLKTVFLRYEWECHVNNMETSKGYVVTFRGFAADKSDLKRNREERYNAAMAHTQHDIIGTGMIDNVSSIIATFTIYVAITGVSPLQVYQIK